MRRSGSPDLDMGFEHGDLGALRDGLVERAAELTDDARQIDALLLIACELASNAVRHGGGRGRLRLWHRGTTLYCAVTDAGPGLTDPEAGRVRADVTALGGRGLWLCRRLAGVLTIGAGPGGVGTAVTAMIPSGRTSSATVLAEQTRDLIGASHALRGRAVAAVAAATVMQRRLAAVTATGA